jgi:hypothetical protein
MAINDLVDTARDDGPFALTGGVEQALLRLCSLARRWATPARKKRRQP